MIKCSICINTYKRPILLKKLLDSLNNQQLDNNVELEIIVADNSPAKEGEKVVSEFSKNSPFTLIYCYQTEKNISLTRNLAVSKSTGDYILFIDDDGYADKYWIKNMLSCLIDYNAAAVFGRVIPYFAKETPNWIKKGGFFDRPCPSTGKNPIFTRTGNCLVKAEVLKVVEGPFDAQYGITGGSDTHLFEKLLMKNAKFVSCYEALVYDYVHPQRANFKWLRNRSLRTGNTHTRRTLEFSNYNIFVIIKLFIKALLYSFISSILIIVSIFSKRLRIFWTLKLIGNVGHILAIFKYHYNEYQ
jgi:succinoglycan biosynthesis protein ExoM